MCFMRNFYHQAVHDVNPKTAHTLKHSLSTRVPEPYGLPVKHDHINNGRVPARRDQRSMHGQKYEFEITHC